MASTLKIVERIKSLVNRRSSKDDDLVIVIPAQKETEMSKWEAVLQAQIKDNLPHSPFKSIQQYRELLESEKGYVKQIFSVDDALMIKMLKEYPNPVAKGELTKAEFGNMLEALIALREEQVKLFEVLLKPKPKPEAWAQQLEKLDAVYARYAASYSRAPIPEHIDEMEKENRGQQPLSSILMQPIQRGMRYNMLASELDKALEKEKAQNPNLPDLSAFLKGTNKFAKRLNEVQAVADFKRAEAALASVKGNFSEEFKIIAKSELRPENKLGLIVGLNFDNIKSEQKKQVREFVDTLKASIEKDNKQITTERNAIVASDKRINALLGIMAGPDKDFAGHASEYRKLKDDNIPKAEAEIQRLETQIEQTQSIINFLTEKVPEKKESQGLKRTESVPTNLGSVERTSAPGLLRQVTNRLFTPGFQASAKKAEPSAKKAEQTDKGNDIKISAPSRPIKPIKP